MTDKEKKEPTFEESLARLEAIVKEMEAGTLSLDKMMAHFEEGSKLVKQCGAKLNDVEKKIERLIEKAPGEITTDLFEDSATP